ncbi:arylsulfatase [Stenotrophobium rhamnosiphilum]|uniref:Arylsulfatase n=1 Tax=Stenotrophobium rhamnosiphilum TaxID=2029166 RepID=A0A2T5MFY1_9GAMM|nr:arylsulfatase [Stenotrophobium rhamnosiphilum]PTU31491.1 arylsulfatase [Stenotrophobium rhamnosiphilum]
MKEHNQKYAARVIALVVLLACVAGCQRSAPAGKSSRPNVLVILVDDLGYSDISAFGGEIATPNIDKLAREGRILSNLHTTPLCATTRAELLTGVDHHLTGLGTMPEMKQFYPANADNYQGVLNNNAPTVSELFRDAGYHTYMAGKWHVGGGGPPAFGFEQSFSLDYAKPEGSNFAPGAGGSSSSSHPYFENGKEATLPPDFFSSDYFVDKLIQYVGKNRGDGRPFFAYLAFQAVHFPLQAPDKYLDLYKGKYDAGYEVTRNARIQRQRDIGLIPADFKPNPGDEALMLRYGQPGVGLNQPWETLLPSDQKSEARIMEVFAGMLTNMDDNIGRLTSYLKHIGEYENTVIVFLADNGADGTGTAPVNDPTQQSDINNDISNYGKPGSYIFRSTRWGEVGTAPFRLFKAFTSEGGISVPTIIRLPGNSKVTAATTAFTSVRDIVPTLLAAASIKEPGNQYQGRTIAPLEGFSLLPVLNGQRGEVRDHNVVLTDEVNDIRVVRRGPWKLTRFVNYLVPPANLLLNHDWQLYNMESDRGETNNVAAAHPEIVAELRAEWKDYVTRVGVVQPTIPPILTPIDD